MSFTPGLPTDEADGLISKPDISPQGESRVRSIKDEEQAQRVVNATLAFNRERMIINGRITAKINAEKPFRQSLLEAEGLGWKSNFTTKPLPTMIEKVGPRFADAIEGLKYLTNSALPSDIPGASRKTDIFRKRFTDLLRGREGWKTLIDDIAQENALYGYTVVANLDDDKWFPHHFRQDEFFIPNGTKQRANTAQITVFKEVFLPHELFKKIENPDEAKTAGWDVPATIDLINNSMPEARRVRTTEHIRMFQDLRRDLNLGFSFEGGARVIVVYTLLAQEISTGKVTHIRLGGDNLKQIFRRNDRFESMDNVMSFFSYQKGNGTMHGSKGIGRDIYELAGIIDRSRNEIVDRLMLSGKLIMQTDDRMVKRFRMSVVGNAILISKGFTILEQAIDGNVTPFLQLDAYLGQIVDQLIGTVSPRQLQGDRVTKAQVDLFAQREEQSQDTKIGRFVNQFVNLMGLIQRRVLDPETSEKDAKDFQKSLLDAGLTPEELEILRNESVAGTISDLTPQQRQQVVLIAQENTGNPLYNQRVLQEEKLTAQIDSDFAEKVLLPDEDPTVTAEQTRFQQMELSLLTQGQAVPVSPRDGHEIHLSVVMPVFDSLAQAIAQGQASTDQMQVLLDHAFDHYSTAIRAGTPPEQLAPIKTKLDQILKLIPKLRELDKQAQLTQQAGSALQEQAGADDATAANSLAISAQLER